MHGIQRANTLSIMWPCGVVSAVRNLFLITLLRRPHPNTPTWNPAWQTPCSLHSLLHKQARERQRLLHSSREIRRRLRIAPPLAGARAVVCSNIQTGSAQCVRVCSSCSLLIAQGS